MSGYAFRFGNYQRLSTAAGILLIALLAAACGGGGGGNGQPTPQFPGAPEEVAGKDLSTAGVPDPSQLGSLGTRSLSIAGDYNNDGIADANDFLAVNNLSLVDGRFVTDVPDGEKFRRIIAWGIWEIPAQQGDHLISLANDISFSPASTRSFFAVANAAGGFWEIGGRIGAQGPETLHFDLDGNSDARLSPNFRFGFSNDTQYIWPNGSAYVLVAIGHPGNANYNGIELEMEGWQWRSVGIEVEEAYAGGANGTCAWNHSGDGLGGGIFNYIEQENLYRMDFLLDDNQGKGHFLFAQPMDFHGGIDGYGPVTAMSSVDAMDYEVWRGAFFRPGEMNCLARPFTLHRVGGIDEDLNAAPLLELPNGNGRGIIAVLIGQFGLPVPSAEVQLISAQDTITLTTGKAGLLQIPLSFFGTDSFTYTLTYDGGSEPLELELEPDPEAGIYRFW